jgi:hypothetical protein
MRAVAFKRLILLCTFIVMCDATGRAQLINADLWKLRKECGG